MSKYYRYSQSYREQQRQFRRTVMVIALVIFICFIIIFAGYSLFTISPGFSSVLAPLGVIILVLLVILVPGYFIIRYMYDRIRSDLKKPLTQDEIENLANIRRKTDIDEYFNPGAGNSRAGELPEFRDGSVMSVPENTPLDLEHFLSGARYTMSRGDSGGIIIGYERDGQIRQILGSTGQFTPGLALPVHQIISHLSGGFTSVISVQKGIRYEYAKNQAMQNLGLNILDFSMDNDQPEIFGEYYSDDFKPLYEYITAVAARNNRSIKGNMRLRIELQEMSGLRADALKWIFSL